MQMNKRDSSILHISTILLLEYHRLVRPENRVCYELLVKVCCDLPSDRLNVGFGQTVRPNLNLAVRPK